MFMKRITKAVLLLLIIAMIGSCFAGCGDKTEPAATTAGTNTPAKTNAATTAPAKKLKFGVSFSTQTEEQWVRRGKLLQQYCDEAGVEMMLQIAEGDASKQYQQCESMISSGINVLIVRCVDSAAAGAIYDMCQKAGVTYFSFDVMTTGAGAKNHYYITMDSVEVGEMQAKAMLALAPKGNYALINGNPASNVAQLFHQGIMNILQPHVDNGDIKIVTDQWAPAYDPTIGLQNFENAMTAQNNNIQAVIPANDAMATPICAEIKAQGLTGKIPVAGLDAEKSACQRVVQGEQTMTIYRPSKDIAKALFEVAVAVASGADYKSAVDVKGEWTTYKNKAGEDVVTFKCKNVLVTKDNMIDTVIKDGWQTYDDVYANIPESQRPPKP